MGRARPVRRSALPARGRAGLAAPGTGGQGLDPARRRGRDHGLAEGSRPTSRRDESVPPRLSLEVAATPGEPGAAEAALYLNRAGLERLRAALDRLAAGEVVQAHLLSGAWGGGGLTEARWRADGLTAHHLKILLRPDSEALREVRYLG